MEVLHLTKNHITHLPSMSGLENLLDLSNSTLKLSESIAGVSHNKIQELPSSISSLKKLRKLNLRFAYSRGFNGSVLIH